MYQIVHLLEHAYTISDMFWLYNIDNKVMKRNEIRTFNSNFDTIRLSSIDHRLN